MSYSRHVFTRDPELSMALDILRWTTKDSFIQKILDSIRSQLIISARDILWENGILWNKWILYTSWGLDEAKKALIGSTRENLQWLYEEIRNVPRDINPAQIWKEGEAVRTSYKSIVKKLLEAKILKPILALDWSVGRDETADSSLWLVKGWIWKLRDILSRRPSSFWKYLLYMDKWPWNGVKLASTNQQPIPEEWNHVIHIGVGDNLYCNVSDILLQWIKKTYRNNPHVVEAMRVISQVVQVQLRKKWYTENTDYAIGKWEEKPDTQYDLNDIYTILRNLRFDTDWDLSQSVLDINKALLFSSEIFEGDDTQTLSAPVLYVICLVLWMQHDQISWFFTSKMMQLQKEVGTLGSEQEKYREDEFSYRKSQLKKLLKNSQAFLTEIQSIVKSSVWKGGFSNFLESNWLRNITHPKDIFEDDFFVWISPSQYSESTPIDLNILPVVYFHNFFRWYFTDIPDKLFPSTAERFMLMTSVRADSHEDESNFRKDIRKNLSKLAQGWVLLSDGITQSFTWLHRISTLKRVLSTHNASKKWKWKEACCAQVLYDPKYESWYSDDDIKTDITQVLNQPRRALLNKDIEVDGAEKTREWTDLRSPLRAIFVQKSWEDSSNWLTDDEFASFLDVEKWVKKVPLEEVENYAGIYIEQKFREIIIGEKQEDVHRLKWKHWAIPITVKEILRRLWCPNETWKPMKYNEDVSKEDTKTRVDREICIFLEDHWTFFNAPKQVGSL